MRIDSAADAVTCLLETVQVLDTEELPLELLYGRIPEEDLYAAAPVPAFFRSAYDGYALRSEDTLMASPERPVTLRVCGTLAAGDTPAAPLLSGTAVRIMTGAQVPEGADAVVMHEKTEFTSDTVTLRAPVPQANVVPPGEDVQKGSLLCRKGRAISASETALLAGQGLEKLSVYRKPRIGLLSTGSELLKAGGAPETGKIYNTNPYLLSGYLLRYGCTPVFCGIADDETECLAGAVSRALLRCDALITTGGVSAGDFDLMPKVMELLSARTLFHRLPFKPGGAMLAAEKDGKLILCLSGNPGAAATGLLHIGLPALRKLAGETECFLPEETAFLSGAFQKTAPVDRIVKGRGALRDGKLFFVPGSNQRNGSVSSFSMCDLLWTVPAGCGAFRDGDRIRVRIL